MFNFFFLSQLLDLISQCCNAVFGHKPTARLSEDIPAHHALTLHLAASLTTAGNVLLVMPETNGWTS